MRGQHVFTSTGGWLALLAIVPSAVTGFDFGAFPGPPISQETSQRDRCPLPCLDVGPTGFSWSVFPSIGALKACNGTFLFESSLQKPITSLNQDAIIRACSLPESPSKRVLAESHKFGPPCLASAELRSVETDVQLSWSRESVSQDKGWDIADALLHLQTNLIENPTCEPTALFAKSGDAVVGVWVGRQIRKSSAASLVELFIDSLSAKEVSSPKKGAAQICGSDISAGKNFGIFYDATGKVSDIHAALQGWSKGGCLSTFEETETWKEVKLDVIPASALSMGADEAIPETKHHNSTAKPTSNQSTASSRISSTIPSTTKAQSKHNKLFSRNECKAVKIEATDSCYTLATQKCGIKLQDLYKYNGGNSEFCENLRVGSQVCCSSGGKPDPESTLSTRAAECKYVVVEKGDSCTGIAQECGITLDEFYSYNRNSKEWCNNLKVRAPVCCSRGELPDLRPQDNNDGSCFTYTVQPGEGCFDIADRHRLTEKELHDLNKGKTWGWTGCGILQRNHKICLSKGTPPMPAPISNAVCGPQKPGSSRPSGSTNLTDLNPCPLNVCCNTWGQCGTTKDFCIDTSVDNTPGTAKEGTYGCISNCGMDIVNKDTAPAKFVNLGYFEGWNFNRPCLNMDVTDIPDKGYDIVHFSFGWISEDFQISAGPDVKEQFDKFVKLETSYKKVLSFGGWAFSNDAATSHIIRNGVKPENSLKFATNVVNFITANKLDGVDFDWEYPGATDIEGSQPGTEADGKNYLAFLKLVRRRLPSGKSLAIAAPASFWYLKAFPIAEISSVVDYIVYMTYDLAGQWDVGSNWAHTMTYGSLSMITKAGVPSHKILVGVSSYARSFKMSKLGCEGPDCTFQGARNQSPAKPGICTETAGYISDAEILQIIRNAGADFDGSTYRSYYDASSDSDIFVYDDWEWAAWMSPTTKDRRKDYYKSLNMGGTTDWAIDLGVDVGERSRNKTNLDWPEMDLSVDCKKGTTYSSLDDLEKDAKNMPAKCAALHALKVLENMLAHSLDGYDAAASGYDGLFGHYKDYIIKTLDGRIEKMMLFTKENGNIADDYFDCYGHKAGERSADRSKASKVTCSDLPKGKPFDDYTYWFEMKDKTKWEKFLETEGILPEWLHYTRRLDEQGLDTCDTNSLCITKNLYYHGYPTPIESGKINVPDPKEIITLARSNMENITDSFDDVYMAIGLEDWQGGYDHAVEIMAVPVFMLEDAVTSMAGVKEIGKDWKEAQEKELMFKIIEGVLFLLGFLGPIAGTMGRVGAAIGRLASLIEGAGATGLAIYSIVEDPASAPLAIFGLLLGELGGGVGRGRRLEDVNAKRNLMTAKEHEALGVSYNKNSPKVRNIMDYSCGKK
ncbi:killer toxin subunits alpha beta [Fusarium sporotrichioides]|uniref:chitinase n=1 Tax=Fusarium sporotrichioides TaxID=5514 RepID=A0A395SC76_FUSSP|nr:killer toxin subunits alpha beta [Fusarium sporotrichioides]